MLSNSEDIKQKPSLKIQGELRRRHNLSRPFVVGVSLGFVRIIKSNMLTLNAVNVTPLIPPACPIILGNEGENTVS